VTQPQVGFSAHSASQLQALPAFSSQYQPVGQMPLPHTLQVPSSQLGPLAALVLLSTAFGASLSASPLPSLTEEAVFSESASVADFASPVALPPPHCGRSKSRAKQQVSARMLPPVYVPRPWGYKRLWIWPAPLESSCPGLP